MEILPPDPPTALQSVTSPVKICSTCFFVRPLIGFAEFTITPIPSKAMIVGFICFPLAAAAPTSEVLARRLDMPISAVPSMIAAIPVVDPSAAMSKVVPGCCALNCSANCGTSLAPSVSEPLMTRRSAFALAMPVATRARLSATCLIFIGVGWFLFSSANIFNLEFHAHIRLKDLVLVERIDLDIAQASSAKRAIDAPGIGICEVKANGIGDHVPDFHRYASLVNTVIEDIRINQVGIQRILLSVLIPRPDLPIVLCL